MRTQKDQGAEQDHAEAELVLESLYHKQSGNTIRMQKMEEVIPIENQMIQTPPGQIPSPEVFVRFSI